MKRTRLVYGHSVSVTGFRLGRSVLWSNKVVQTSLNKDYSLALFGYFWYQYFYKFFYLNKNKKIYRLWREYFGLSLESLTVWQTYKVYNFRFDLYIDLVNFLYKNVLPIQVKRQLKGTIPVPASSLSKKKVSRGLNPRDTFFNRSIRINFFDKSNPFHFNLLVYADHLIRERNSLSAKIESRLYKNSSKRYVNYFNVLSRKFVSRRVRYLRNSYSLFLFHNFYKHSNFYRVYSSVNHKLLNNRFLKNFILKLIIRFERFFYFYKLLHSNFVFIRRFICRELLTVFKANELEVDLSTSSSFAYPNVASQFIILKLRKWYRIGEIFGSLKRIFARKKMLRGLVVRAKGRLTKRQRATKQLFRVGPTPFSSPLKPLFYYHKVYPLKYGASAISVCFYLRTQRGGS